MPPMPDAALPPPAAARTHPGSAPTASTRPQPHAVVFTGSGREYFRVWIVNVLLTVVTLALYTPLARRRTAQYFYSHTLVAGTPLVFSASVRRMLLGFLVFVLLYAVTEAANRFGGAAVRVAVSLTVVALLPFFWGSAMRFRLRATRWRGVRMAFAAGWGQVYRASWPLLLLLTLWLAAMELLLYGFTVLEKAGETPSTPLFLLSLLANPWLWTGLSVLLFVVPVLGLLALAVQEFNYRRLLVRRTRVGQQSGYWAQPRRRPFIGAWFVAALLALLGTGISGALLAALLAGLSGLPGTGAPAGAILLTLLFIALGLPVLFLAFTPGLAYHEARVFRTVWNDIGLGRVLRTRCNLSVWGYVGLRTRNSLLTVLTLGFYRPYARVAEYRRKAESVTLYVKGGLEQLEGQLVREQGMLGDAVADAIGLEII